MIKIYRAEADISELIVANTSFAYQHEISLLSTDVSQQEKIKAGLSSWLDGILKLPSKGGERDSDLHYVQSVLVTTNWNKNDDVFDPQEVWDARHTPQHKPTNIGHDEHEIVGHMTTNWVIDQDGKMIDDNIAINDLPMVFHVVNGSVIYKAFQDEKLLQRAQNLIEEIDVGRKFVSMECMFTGFDYAILTLDNQSKVVARNDETSFLTKHLRAYGGTGLYDGFKVGRLLRNITFTGKGFVDKPANPNSIIFDKDKIFNFAEAQQDIVFSASCDNNGVSISTDNNPNDEEIFMTDVLKDYNAELKAKNDELTKQIAEVNDKLARSDIEKFEKDMAKMANELKASQAKIEELKESVEKHSDSAEEATKELSDVKADRDKLQSELNEVKANELRTNRISSLVDGGLEKDIAEKKVDLYENLSDEQFTDLANELIEIAKMKSETHSEETTDDTTEEVTESSDDVSDEEVDDADAETDVLDNVEQGDDVDLASSDESGESDNDNNIRSKLSNAFAQMLKMNDVDDSDSSDKEN